MDADEVVRRELIAAVCTGEKLLDQIPASIEIGAEAEGPFADPFRRDVRHVSYPVARVLTPSLSYLCSAAASLPFSAWTTG